MGIEDPKAAKSLIFDTKKRVNDLIGKVDHDMNELLKTFLTIADIAEKSLEEATGGTADYRVMKKKYDQLKKEMRPNEEKIEFLRDKILPLVAAQIKVINEECMGIMNRHTLRSLDLDHDSATQIKSATQKILVTLFKESGLSLNPSSSEEKK